MQLFGPVHVLIVLATALTAVILAVLCRQNRISGTKIRILLGSVLAANELIWWAYRYSQEGLQAAHNLPLQLCDLVVWTTVLACFRLTPAAAEFSYYVGLPAAAMSVLTPDLWSPWPSYPAIYFFVGHAVVVIAVVVLVFGKVVTLRRGAVWRVFGFLLLYGFAVGVFNLFVDGNYMYLCQRPVTPSLLHLMGPWPIYIVTAAGFALSVFCLLWLPVREKVYDTSDVEPVTHHAA